jgi:hypothetical protein
MPAVREGIKAVGYQLPVALQRKIKIDAAYKSIPISEVVRLRLERDMLNHPPGRDVVGVRASS